MDDDIFAECKHVETTDVDDGYGGDWSTCLECGAITHSTDSDWSDPPRLRRALDLLAKIREAVQNG